MILVGDRGDRDTLDDEDELTELATEVGEMGGGGGIGIPGELLTDELGKLTQQASPVASSGRPR
jgi:hypothetical protein